MFFGVPGAFDQLTRRSVDTCHWTASTLPVALALNVAVLPVSHRLVRRLGGDRRRRPPRSATPRWWWSSRRRW